MQETSFRPELGRSSGEVSGNSHPPHPVSLPGKSHGQRSLAGHSPGGRRVRRDCANVPYSTLIQGGFKQQKRIVSRLPSRKSEVNATLLPKPHRKPRPSRAQLPVALGVSWFVAASLSASSRASQASSLCVWSFFEGQLSHQVRADSDDLIFTR